MKTILVIMSVWFAVGLAAGIIVPHDAMPEAAVLAADQTNTEPPPNPSDPLVTPADRGAPIPLADIVGVAGLLGGSVVTVLLLQGGRPGGGRVRPDPRRHATSSSRLVD